MIFSVCFTTAVVIALASYLNEGEILALLLPTHIPMGGTASISVYRSYIPLRSHVYFRCESVVAHKIIFFMANKYTLSTMPVISAPWNAIIDNENIAEKSEGRSELMQVVFNVKLSLEISSFATAS